MNGIPDTRASLMIRLQEASDRDAWIEFADIYRPVIYRMGRRRGLQDADAQDLAQGVLSTVAKQVATWEHDPKRARFRTWLTTVTRNAIVDSIRRQKPDAGAGGTGMVETLNQLPGTDAETVEEITREYRRQLFRRAAAIAMSEFEAASWEAFCITSIEGRSVGDAAATLGKTVGSVYAARSRIVRRLKEIVLAIEVDDELSSGGQP